MTFKYTAFNDRRMGRSRFQILFIFLFFVPVHSVAMNINCFQLLNWPTYKNKIDQLFSDEFAEHLVKELSPAVKIIYQQDPELGPDSMEKIFSYYLEHRLSALTPSLQEKIYDLVESGIKTTRYEPSASSTSPLSAISHRRLFMIFLSLSEFAHQTALDYFVRIHEIEHIIQYYSAGTWSLSELHPYQHLNLFYLEQGAMRSEAAFLRILPPQYLQSLLEKWKAHPHQLGFADELYENSIVHALSASSVQEYLELQWKSGRYTKATYQYRQKAKNIKLWATTALLTSPLWLKLTDFL